MTNRDGSLVPSRTVLKEGKLCYVSSSTADGPFVAPVPFAYSGGRVWFTMSRTSDAVRSWREGNFAAALVRYGYWAVSLVGVVRIHDVLDPSTWVGTGLDLRGVAAAGAAYAAKNRMFFRGRGGFPLGWMPPGRVFVEFAVHGAVVIDTASGEVGNWSGRPWVRRLVSHPTFRASKRGEDPLARLPVDVASAVGGRGDAAVALASDEELVVVPARWSRGGASLYAAASRRVLELAAGGPVLRAAMAVNGGPSWRAKDMAGILVRGEGDLHDLKALGSGARSASARVAATGASGDGAVLLKLTPGRLSWWRGTDVAGGR
ncbi:MAG: hypothetical protein WD276_01055 [Actinomycetota bacterium]